MAATSSVCVNCESESRMMVVKLILDNKAIRSINICQRCNDERKLEVNDLSGKHSCVCCGKWRRIVFRQACRQTYTCLNCLTHESLLSDLSVELSKTIPIVPKPLVPAAKPAPIGVSTAMEYASLQMSGNGFCIRYFSFTNCVVIFCQLRGQLLCLSGSWHPNRLLFVVNPSRTDPWLMK